jgi:hypothetical protein
VLKDPPYDRAAGAQKYSFGIGEHVWVDGRDGEFVVVEVNRKDESLQLLPLGQIGRIVTAPASSVRVVVPPKSKADKEVGYVDPNAA